MKDLTFVVLISLLLLACDAPHRYVPPEKSEAAITGIEIFLSSERIFVSEQTQAKALMLYATGGKEFAGDTEVEWLADGSGVFSVDETGLLTGIVPGEGIVSASARGFSASALITVERKADFSRVMLSEVFYDDVGADEGKEFIELYNGNDYACDISGFRLIDGSLSSTPFILPAGTMIGPLGRVVIARSADDFFARFGSYPGCSGFSFSLNNSGETVMLMKPDGSVHDRVIIEGGVDPFAADDAWGSASLPAAPEGNSVYRIQFTDTDTFLDWESGEPTPGD